MMGWLSKLFQQVINKLYRHPRSVLKNYGRFGGYFQYRQMLQGQKDMAGASLKLPPVQSHPDGLPIHFLTGKNYLYQTLFCITSLTKASSEYLKFVLVDDGSFDDFLLERIKKQLPGSTIITKEIIDRNLNAALPQQQNPNLHAKREVYPHLKKLTDVHTIPGDDWKIVLDSDMLFWKEPVELLNWLKAPNRPLHMIDCVESYGYSIGLMERLSGTTIPSLLNVGAIGLKSASINWANLDNWIKTLEEQEGASYYLEQALTAMLIGNDRVSLDKAKYIVNPTRLNNPTDVLHHYVDLSKKLYYQQAWRQFID